MQRPTTLSRFGFLAALTVVCLSALLTAQSEKLLRSFGSNSTDGELPASYLTMDVAGNLYGTTVEGGLSNSGIVFELIPRATGEWREKVLYRFPPQDLYGIAPLGALVFDSSGNLYGTTSRGGSSLEGTVFQLSPVSDGSWKEKVLYNFQGTSNDGVIPKSLIFDSKGSLLGTTTVGGTNATGSIFKLSPAGDGTWTYATLHNFENYTATDGVQPADSLTLDSKGNIFGTTVYGGANSRGTVFELSPSGNSFHYRVLYNFRGGDSDGANPESNLVFDSEGNLYGSTNYGGAADSDFGGDGTIFKLTPLATGEWSETIIYSFKVNNNIDGVRPTGRLLFAHSGNLYGTTYGGGTMLCSCGTVFELKPQNGSWIEVALHNFGDVSNGPDGSGPDGLIMDSRGDLYGTTLFGGLYGHGTAFALRP